MTKGVTKKHGMVGILDWVSIPVHTCKPNCLTAGKLHWNIQNTNACFYSCRIAPIFQHNDMGNIQVFQWIEGVCSNKYSFARGEHCGRHNNLLTWAYTLMKSILIYKDDIPSDDEVVMDDCLPFSLLLVSSVLLPGVTAPPLVGDLGT